MKDLPTQIQLMRLHRELYITLEMLPDEEVDGHFGQQIEDTILSIQKRFLPEFGGNLLLGYTPGTEEWDKQMRHIERTYNQ